MVLVAVAVGGAAVTRVAVGVCFSLVGVLVAVTAASGAGRVCVADTAAMMDEADACSQVTAEDAMAGYL
jgi:hypothetical protein